MTEQSSPAPGTPQTGHKAHMGGIVASLAPVASAVVHGLITGEWPDLSEAETLIAGVLTSVGAYAFGWYAVWKKLNYPLPGIRGNKQ